MGEPGREEKAGQGSLEDSLQDEVIRAALEGVLNLRDYYR
jgi:hypothetical protein